MLGDGEGEGDMTRYVPQSTTPRRKSNSYSVDKVGSSPKRPFY